MGLTISSTTVAVIFEKHLDSKKYVGRQKQEDFLMLVHGPVISSRTVVSASGNKVAMNTRVRTDMGVEIQIKNSVRVCQLGYLGSQSQ